MGDGSATDLWPIQKDILAVVEAAVVAKQPGFRLKFEYTLKTNKGLFEKLLANPPPTTQDAELLKKATTEGILLAGGETPTQLSQSLVDEAQIVSNLFNLNQISALHLLIHGEDQLPQYPGLTRGLVAVLLYYDGRKAVAQALRTLISSRPGLAWSTDIPEETATFVTNYTTELLNAGLVSTILKLLTSLDWDKDLAELQKKAALGDAQHVSTLRLLHADTRQSLADSVYCYAAQAGLPTQITIKLLDHLSTVAPGEGNGAFDEITLALIMATLQALDCSGAGRDDLDLALVSDPNFIPAVSKQLDGRTRKWVSQGLLGLLQFCWSMSLSGLRVGGFLTPDSTPQLEDDEAFMDLALEARVFHVLPDLIFSSPAFAREEFYQRRLHALTTDFINLMPLKIKELRNRADDAARNKMMHEQEGIQYSVPLVGQHFQQLLVSIAHLYAGDSLDLGLAEAYWFAADTGGGLGVGSDSRHCPAKQISLYKFVRLAGDLLMPSLFVPYITMLAGLADSNGSAPYCFNLLKMNANGSSNISLDHFFSSLQQYYNNLRQETPVGPDHTIYRTKPMTRGISPQEVEGLMAVLELLTTLAKRCEAARLCMVEHPSWATLATIIGLLACSMPTHIKSRLVLFLAALARSPDNVHTIWQHVEVQQLVGGQGGKPGVTEELEEIETRYEEYPLTRSFLELLDKLTDVEIPGNLGAGSRAPGLLPYINYVQDSVLLKFSSRTYKDPAERWEVASLALSLLQKLVNEYEPNIADFQGGSNAVGLHPGFYILLHLHQSSLLLRTVLYVIDECKNLLDTFSPFPGKKKVEAAAGAALRLIYTGLKFSEDFISAGRNAGASVVLTSLSKLLLGINPRSGRADHLLNISRYILYGFWMPAAKFHAIHILTGVAASPANQMDLLATFTATNEISHAVLKAFTEALDAEEEEESSPPGSATKDYSAARLAIIELLQTGLNMASPTLAHFLLGFDVRRGVEQSQLQNPKIAGIRTPLHAILGLLSPEEPGVPAAIVSTAPALSTAMYKLIYTMVATPDTSDPILRFLRSSCDFLPSQLACVTNILEKEGIHSMRSVAWLLKSTAVELRILMKSRQSSQLSKILSLLLDAHDNFEDSVAQDASRLYSDSTFTQLSRTMLPSQSKQINAPLANHRLATILNFINFEVDSISPPSWDLFDDSQVSTLLNQCQVDNKESSVHEKLIMVPKLHKILAQELANLQGSTALNQRALIQSEIQSILMYAVRWNSVQENAASKRDLLEAWRQVTEVLLIAAPAEHLPPVSKQQILLQLLQTLLNKVSIDETVPGLTILVSSAVLLLLTSLRDTYDTSPDKKSVLGSTFVGILDASAIECSSNEIFSSSLQVILKGLVNWINSVGGGSQLIRTNLYAALVAYLRIGKSSKAESARSLELSERGKLQKVNMEVIQSIGTGFLEVLSRDACSGHEVRRMLSLAVLDELIFMDRNNYCVRFLAEHGFIKHVVESLVKEEAGLISLLTKPAGNVRDMYVYESKVGLLSRVATSHMGAEILLQAGLLTRLAELSVIDLRPDPDAILLRNEEDLTSGVLKMYHNIFFPILRLIQSILSTMGAGNKSAAYQTVRFLSAHDDVFSQILRGSTARSSLNPTLLQELALVTAVVSRAATIDLKVEVNDVAGFELAGQLSRVQRQMLGLLSQFQLTPDLIGSLEGQDSAQCSGLLLVLKIVSNVTSYARTVVSASGNNSKTCRLVVSPSLLDATESSSSGAVSSRPASLGLVVMSIKHLANHLSRSQVELHELKEKESSLPTFPTSELAVLAGVNTAQKLPGIAIRQLAAARLDGVITDKQLDVQLSAETVESLTFLMWRHLEHYLLYSSAALTASPATPYQATVRRLNEGKDPIGMVQSPRSNFPQVDLEKLKGDVQVVLNDTFFDKLGDIVEVVEKQTSSGTSTAGFLQAIIRRSKRLALLHT